MLREQGHDVHVPRSAQIDLVQRDQVLGYFSGVQPDLVYHLAAKVGGIGANRLHPGMFFYENMQMGLNVLEAARIQRTGKVVIAGTVCAYPKFCPVPFKEDDLWEGYPEETNAPYGIAKKALLVMAQAYRQEYGSNFVMAFPTNLYGPGDNFNPASSHVIPALIRKFETAKRESDSEVRLWGDGSATREFLHVKDAARGLITVAEKHDAPEPVNLGAGKEISIRDLAGILREATGFKGEIRWDPSMPNGQPHRSLEVSRAKALGWEAQEPFSLGLRQTVEWFREHGEVS